MIDKITEGISLVIIVTSGFTCLAVVVISVMAVFGVL